VALVLGLALRARLCAVLALVLVAGPAHREAADVAGDEELPVRHRAHAVAADLAHLPGPVLPRIRSAAAAAAVHGARADHSPATNPSETPQLGPRRLTAFLGFLGPRTSEPPRIRTESTPGSRDDGGVTPSPGGGSSTSTVRLGLDAGSSRGTATQARGEERDAAPARRRRGGSVWGGEQRTPPRVHITLLAPCGV